VEGLPINLTDIIVLVIVVLSALIALARGFVHEVLGVFAWVGAALPTLYLFADVQVYARQLISIDLLADVAAGVCIFLVSLVILSIIAGFVGRRVQASSLSMLDRSLGVLFGLVRGAVIACLVWMLVAWLLPPPERPVWIREARSLPLLQAGANWLQDLAPPELRLQGERAMEQAKDVSRGVQNLQPLLAPQSGAGGSAAQPPAGYNEQQRRELDRLIETQQ